MPNDVTILQRPKIAHTYPITLIDGSKKAIDSNQLVLKGVMPTSIYAGYLIYLFANPHNNQASKIAVTSTLSKTYSTET
mgnify:CR=1 FL=1